jgi:hypothetical protein
MSFQTPNTVIPSGLGNSWLSKARASLARIRATEASNSSGSDDDAEAERMRHTQDYVEARTLLLPAADFLRRAVGAARRTGRLSGSLLVMVCHFPVRSPLRGVLRRHTPLHRIFSLRPLLPLETKTKYYESRAQRQASSSATFHTDPNPYRTSKMQSATSVKLKRFPASGSLIICQSECSYLFPPQVLP